jgi:hypothetical protein
MVEIFLEPKPKGGSRISSLKEKLYRQQKKEMIRDEACI